MKCEDCGTENLEGATFCKKCGKKFEYEYKITKTSKGQIDNDENYKKESSSLQLEQNSNEMNLENKNNSLAVYCQCGQKLKPSWKFCPNCKMPITVVIKNTDDVEQDQNEKDGMAILYITIFIVSLLSAYFFSFSLGGLIAIIDIIAGKINCPHNKIIKTVFWSIVLLYIGLILLAIFCAANNFT